MPRGTSKPDWQRAVIALSGSVISALIVLTLYHARVIFIPLALAVFLTFVLSPLVRYLERHRVPRVPAALAVVALALLTVGSIAWVVGQQVAGLTATLPDNEKRIAKKIEEVKSWITGPSDPRLAEAIKELQKTISPPAKDQTADGSTPPPEVVVTPRGSSWLTRFEGVMSPAAEVIGQLAFAFILVVFMLLKKEDLRNRVLRLIGAGRVTTATKAVDDASRRVSRYLLMQLLINSGFGITVSIGMLLIGVQYALLWGFFATVMRYIPYIGTWIGLIPPTLFSFALSDSVWQPFVVIGLFLGVEAICNNVFEPWLFGTSLGVSEVAQLLSAAFWSFLWGPIGLVLSNPLTTCLLVLGKYVPRLKFLDVLLGHDPPLAPSVMFFQRLAARDEDEAYRIVHQQVADRDLADVFDEVVIPALTLTKTAAEERELDADDESYILTTAGEVIEEIGDDTRRRDAQGTVPTTAGPRVKVLSSPARGEADRAALAMLSALLAPDKWEAEVAAAETLTSELISLVEESQPAVVCIGSLPPGGLSHTRYVCKRLRARFPELKIVVGRWGQQDEPEEARKELIEAGAEEVYFTLAEARQQLTGWLPVLQARFPEAGADLPQGGETLARRTAVGTAPA